METTEKENKKAVYDEGETRENQSDKKIKASH